MSYVKTAISIKKPLLQEVDNLSRQMNIPRSRLFVRAVEEFIERQRNLELLEQINETYSEYPSPDEKDQLSQMKLKHRQKLAEKNND